MAWGTKWPRADRRLSVVLELTRRVAKEPSQCNSDRPILVGRDIDLDQLALAGSTSNKPYRPAPHRERRGDRSEGSVRCLPGVGRFDNTNDERASVFTADNRR
jgi:hypothetical protein